MNILNELDITEKKNIIKNDNALSKMFKDKTNKSILKAKEEDIENFINELNEEDKNKIIHMVKKDDKNSSENSTEKKEINDEIIRKILKDLYPTAIAKNKYIQENQTLKMAALQQKLNLKTAKKEDIDEFLVKQITKNNKILKQLGVDWLDNKKSLKFQTDKLSSDNLSEDDVRSILLEVTLDDLEVYCYLVQDELNKNVFNIIENIKTENLKAESSNIDSDKVKNLEAKIRELENKILEIENKHKEEINNNRQNYEIEKEKLKNKYEQKLETQRLKYEEEKANLVKIQADSDRRFAEERKLYNDKIEALEKENKRLSEKLNEIGSDLISQNKQNKDVSKSLTRIQNRIEELQTENKELNSKNEELKEKYDSVLSQFNQLKRQDMYQQQKIQELTLKLSYLEKLRLSFLINEEEIQNIVKELNNLDEDKDRILKTLNIDTKTRKLIGSNLALDELWIKLIENEENIIADYLELSINELNKDELKDKIDALLDLEYNIKTRQILVKLLYEKGYKAYKNFQK